MVTIGFLDSFEQFFVVISDFFQKRVIFKEFDAQPFIGVIQVRNTLVKGHLVRLNHAPVFAEKLSQIRVCHGESTEVFSLIVEGVKNGFYLYVQIEFF